jgi:hypothetical protein
MPVSPAHKAITMSNEKKMMQIVGAISRETDEEKKTFWTRIGVAFQNKDGSWNLRFDYVPARLADTTIQLREFDSNDSAKDAPAQDKAQGRPRNGARA